MRTASANGYWKATYFPDTTHAQLEFMVSIGYLNPSVSPRMYISLTNVDDTLGRYLYVYVDGDLKQTKIIYGPQVQVDFDCSSWCNAYDTFLLKLEVYFGGAGYGWRLDDLWIDDAVVTFNAYDAPNMNVGFVYPYQILTVYAYLDNYIHTFPRITAQFESTQNTGRYVYLYINDQYIGYQISWSPNDGDVLSWQLPDKNTLNLEDHVAKIQFRVYVPCSTCTQEIWTLKNWNTEYIFSWKTLLINDRLTFATDWIPSSTAQNDIKMGIKYFSYTMFQLFEGQVIYTNFEVDWNLIADGCANYYDTGCNPGDFNIYDGSEIPGWGSNRAFTSGGKSYYSETSPNYNGHFGNNKWETVNKQVPILFDAFLFAHEFSHMEFGLPDQYDEQNRIPPCPNYIMGRSGDINGEITPNFSNRWVSIPSHCATNLPPGWISDFEEILSTHPEFLAIYYFANDSGDPSPQNLFDFLTITEVTY